MAEGFSDYLAHSTAPLEKTRSAGLEAPVAAVIEAMDLARATGRVRTPV